MDSHGSVSPTRTPPTAGVDATSRSAGGDVTRRRQTDRLPAPTARRINAALAASGPAEIVEFRDVHRRDDGVWTATHFRSGVVIEADTFECLAKIEAPQVRILHAWRTKGLLA